MPTKEVRLTPEQRAVLLWIRDGCPPGVYGPGYEHRIRARALESRGLVEVSGHGASWQVKLTPAGLAEAQPQKPGRTDMDPTTHQDGLTDESSVRPDRITAAAPDQKHTISDSRREPSTHSEADDLVRRVVEAGGRLDLPEGYAAEAEHRRLVELSLRSPERPHGKKLEVVRAPGASWMGPWQIQLATHFEDLVDPTPVPVPEHVHEYHPAVKQFISDKDWHYVAKDELPRAARLLQAIAVEALRRGWTVKGVSDQELTGVSQFDRSKLRRYGHLALVSANSTHWVQVRELAGKGGAPRTPGPGGRRAKPHWLEYRQTEFVSTGKLELIVRRYAASYDGTHYRDTKRTPIEGHLPELFRAIEVYDLQTAAAEQERQRQEEARQRGWEAAMLQARVAWARDARWKHFEEWSKKWQLVEQHRDLLEQVQAAAETRGVDERDGLLEELSFVADAVNAIDPVLHPELLIPQIPEPSPKDLEPFLNGWSPYGPDGPRG